MRIAFITPPSPFLLDERVFPALGILKVAAQCAAEGFAVEHLDLNGLGEGEGGYEDVVEAYCRTTDAEVFALTATTPQMPACVRIADKLRELKPKALLVIGGPHPTLTNAALKHSERAQRALYAITTRFHIIIAGDGELALGEALRRGWNGVVDVDDPKHALFLDAKKLAALPLPARDLVDLDSYHYQIDGMRVTPIISQLGCPFGCNFCAGRDSAMLRRTRLRSSDAVLDEMRHIYERYGFHAYMFFNDELNVDPNLIELLRGMVKLQEELGVEFRCRGFVKAELLTEEQAEWLHRAGFRRLMCGFESGSERVLRNINKRATRAQNTRAMQISNRYGLGMKALMSLGHPGESRETVRETTEWLLEVEPQDFDCTIITAYPGSPYYDRAISWGDGNWGFETHGDWLFMKDVDYSQQADFYKGAPGEYKSYVWTQEVSAEEIVELRDRVEDTVRTKLGIPYYAAGEARRFEASMGSLPGYVYRKGSGN